MTDTQDVNGNRVQEDGMGQHRSEVPQDQIDQQVADAAELRSIAQKLRTRRQAFYALTQRQDRSGRASELMNEIEALERREDEIKGRRVAVPGVATVERHTYTWGREFFLVVCYGCYSVINSGHHFPTADIAQEWADQHNAERHAPVSA